MNAATAALLLALATPASGAPLAPEGKGTASVPTAGGSAVLRYDLRPGDHLVYRQRLERRLRSSRVESLSELEWQSHVLVVDAGDGFVRVGFQRNRTRAELKRYYENGSDRLEQGRRDLAEALARRGNSFAESNWLRPDGVGLVPWSAVREATSERLLLFHEIEPLPAQPLAPGSAFDAPGLLGMPMRAIAVETVAGEECLRLQGESASTSVRQWHCPGTGTLGRLEYEAHYGAPGGVDVTESLRMERISASRGETTAAWLRDAATARGALASLSASDRLSLPTEVIYAALEGADAEVQRQVLGVAWRHRLPPPPLEPLRSLASSPSVRVRTLAVRLLGLRSEPDARAICERAASDADVFVRQAARPRAPIAEDLLRLARAVRGREPLPPWSGPLEDGIGRKLLLAQRAAGQVAGATLRFTSHEPSRSRPYVLYVPDDYRGAAPFPLVIVLGGGPGRAIPTAQGAHAELDTRGALAVFPQANGMWWEDEPGAAVEALLDEVLGQLNVDSDRVTITGFSNGGTGTLLFASRTPDRFAAFASLMGAGLPFFEDKSPIDPAALARLPALFVHGDHDETIPPWASETTVKALRRANPEGTAELHVLPGRAHDVVIGRDDGLTLPFLERFTRDAFPRRVALRAARLEHARAYWVQALEKGGGTAAIDAAVDGQTLALRTRNVRKLRLRLTRQLLDLSLPVRVTINGREAYAGPVQEDPALFLRSWREAGDPQLAYAAELVLDVK